MTESTANAASEAQKGAPPVADVVIDAVVIGRNEGARLTHALTALSGQVRRVVYVDSGSDDGSPAAARAAGAHVVALDMAQPFTAARARNAGLAALAGDPPDLVQFLDGDCVLDSGWLDQATRFLAAHPQVAAVCGRRREIAPDASLYNRLCDWEWNTQTGPTRATGGDVLLRDAALRAIGGYRDDIIAGEDNEMSQRLLEAGHAIYRLDADMSWHDAAMTRLGQFWRRALRAGHAFAQLGRLYPGYFAAERRRALIWAAGFPALALAGAGMAAAASAGWTMAGLALLALVTALHGLSLARAALRFRRIGLSNRHAAQAAALIWLSKYANLAGMALYHWRRWRGTPARIIEYKAPAGAGR